MNFQSIYSSTMNKCNVDTDDDQAIKVIKDGINEGYKEVARESKPVATATITPINKLISLPDDILEILNIDPPLSDADQLLGNNIITDKIDAFTFIYSYLPDDMVKDKDEPEIPLKYHSLLVAFGCYKYYQFKKKNDVAADYYNNFKSDLNNLRTTNYSGDSIQAVYSLW